MYVFREIICRWYSGTYVYVRRRKKLACPEAVKAYYRMGLAYLARDQFDLAKVGTLAWIHGLFSSMMVSTFFTWLLLRVHANKATRCFSRYKLQCLYLNVSRSQAKFRQFCGFNCQSFVFPSLCWSGFDENNIVQERARKHKSQILEQLIRIIEPLVATYRVVLRTSLLQNEHVLVFVVLHWRRHFQDALVSAHEIEPKNPDVAAALKQLKKNMEDYKWRTRFSPDLNRSHLVSALYVYSSLRSTTSQTRKTLRCYSCQDCLFMKQRGSCSCRELKRFVHYIFVIFCIFSRFKREKVLSTLKGNTPGVLHQNIFWRNLCTKEM